MNQIHILKISNSWHWHPWKIMWGATYRLHKIVHSSHVYSHTNVQFRLLSVPTCMDSVNVIVSVYIIIRLSCLCLSALNQARDHTHRTTTVPFRRMRTEGNQINVFGDLFVCNHASCTHRYRLHFSDTYTSAYFSHFAPSFLVSCWAACCRIDEDHQRHRIRSLYRLWMSLCTQRYHQIPFVYHVSKLLDNVAYGRVNSP
jgi:hypothetical protein